VDRQSWPSLAFQFSAISLWAGHCPIYIQGPVSALIDEISAALPEVSAVEFRFSYFPTEAALFCEPLVTSVTDAGTILSKQFESLPSSSLLA
jgi:hypothetical protein